MMVNVEKTKIVHFLKSPRIPVTEATFQYGEQQIQVVDRYRYLGLIFTEYLDLPAWQSMFHRLLRERWEC